jgi:hypothetical protein
VFRQKQHQQGGNSKTIDLSSRITFGVIIVQSLLQNAKNLCGLL